MFANWVNSDSLNYIWRTVKNEAGITDFRLHDLRHEAISRFVEAGFSDLEVMNIAGHLSHAMLVRYAHLRPASIVAKLDARAVVSLAEHWTNYPVKDEPSPTL
jgi:integrase